jgi:hypothetical protein
MVFVEVNGTGTLIEINNMTLRAQLRKDKTVRGRRWTVKRDTKDDITEVKMIYNPQEYETYKNAKPMFGDKKLLKILEAEREKKRLRGDA